MREYKLFEEMKFSIHFGLNDDLSDKVKFTHTNWEKKAYKKSTQSCKANLGGSLAPPFIKNKGRHGTEPWPTES